MFVAKAYFIDKLGMYKQKNSNCTVGFRNK